MVGVSFPSLRHLRAIVCVLPRIFVSFLQIAAVILHLNLRLQLPARYLAELFEELAPVQSGPLCVHYRPRSPLKIPTQLNSESSQIRKPHVSDAALENPLPYVR